MSTAEIDRQIQLRTEAFAAELTQLIKKAALESVSKALGGGGKGRGSAAAIALAGARKKGEKRTAESLQALTERLYAEIKTGPGRRIEEIAESMGAPTKELALPAKKLLESKRIKTSGHKRATKYFPK